MRPALSLVPLFALAAAAGAPEPMSTDWIERELNRAPGRLAGVNRHLVAPKREPVNPCADCGDALTQAELKLSDPVRRLCRTCTLAAPGRERHRLKLLRRAQRAGLVPAVEG